MLMSKKIISSFDMDKTLFIEKNGKWILNPAFVSYLLYCKKNQIPIFINTKRDLIETIDIAMNNEPERRVSNFLQQLSAIGITEKDIVFVTPYDVLEKDFYKYLLDVENRVFSILDDIKKENKEISKEDIKKKFSDNQKYKELKKEINERVSKLKKQYFLEKNKMEKIDEDDVRYESFYDDDNKCKEQQFSFIMKMCCDYYHMSAENLAVAHIDDSDGIIKGLNARLAEFAAKKQQLLEMKDTSVCSDIEKYLELREFLTLIYEQYPDFDKKWQSKTDNGPEQRWINTVNSYPDLKRRWQSIANKLPDTLKIGQLKTQQPNLISYFGIKAFLKKWDFLQYIKKPVHYNDKPEWQKEFLDALEIQLGTLCSKDTFAGMFGESRNQLAYLLLLHQNFDSLTMTQKGYLQNMTEQFSFHRKIIKGGELEKLVPELKQFTLSKIDEHPVIMKLASFAYSFSDMFSSSPSTAGSSKTAKHPEKQIVNKDGDSTKNEDIGNAVESVNFD